MSRAGVPEGLIGPLKLAAAHEAWHRPAANVSAFRNVARSSEVLQNWHSFAEHDPRGRAASGTATSWLSKFGLVARDGIQFLTPPQPPASQPKPPEPERKKIARPDPTPTRGFS
jgi:hypothetical protein